MGISGRLARCLVITLAIAAWSLGPQAIQSAVASTFYPCNSYHCYSLGAQDLTMSGLEGQWHDLTDAVTGDRIDGCLGCAYVPAPN